MTEPKLPEYFIRIKDGVSSLMTHDDFLCCFLSSSDKCNSYCVAFNVERDLSLDGPYMVKCCACNRFFKI